MKRLRASNDVYQADFISKLDPLFQSAAPVRQKAWAAYRDRLSAKPLGQEFRAVREIMKGELPRDT
jgi:hypothetical protein